MSYNMSSLTWKYLYHEITESRESLRENQERNRECKFCFDCCTLEDMKTYYEEAKQKGRKCAWDTLTRMADTMDIIVWSTKRYPPI